MLRALEMENAGSWREAAAIDQVTLDLDARRKRRQTLTGERGTTVLLDLPAVPNLKDGDGLMPEDGRMVLVRAATEALIEVEPRDPADLARIAWHLGNRHLPVQFAGDVIRLRADHVIADMLQKLGADVRSITAPFDPEGGAYGHGHTHAHD
jgi:urease accessory protein